jgi:putative ABC transport system permease protein
MIRNYLLTAWRNLRKNKFNATINVIGLSVAFTCCILLFLLVKYEFSFDSFQQHRDQLYQVYSSTLKSTGEDKGESMGAPAAPAFKKEVGGIVASTGIKSAGHIIRYKGREVSQRISLVEPDFFTMFTFPVIAGRQHQPLAALTDVVLSQSAATAIFGKEDPIGKPIEINVGDWKAVTVSAVLADAPDNSMIKFSVLARPEIQPSYPQDKDNWNHQDHPVFVQLAPNTLPAATEKDLQAVVMRHKVVNDEQMRTQGYLKNATGSYMTYKLEKLTDIHFDENLSGGDATNKNYLYTLILIAVVVMVIACFNFVNLNVARSFTRAKEVGIRKTIGAGSRQIYFQLWAESLLLFLLATGLAIAAASSLLQPFNDLFTEKLHLSTLLQPGVLLTALGGAILVSFLAGGYPAWLVARFNTVEVLKGKVSVRRSSLLRNGLITFQFVLASALISGTLVIYRQFSHLRSASLGYVQESVISVPLHNSDNSTQYTDLLRMRLGSQPWVAGLTASGINIGIGEDHSTSHWGVGFTYKGQGISTAMNEVDYDYLSVLGMKPIAGRDFSRSFATDTATNISNVIVTESMARQFGIKNAKDAVGLDLYSADTTAPKWRIIGVIPDFHLYSMNEHLRPTTLTLNRHGGLNYIFVKVRTTNPRVTLSLVQTAIHQIEPNNTGQASYLTENTERWYEKESRLSAIFFSSAAIAVLLSCLGLFAIVMLVMEQRRKEIGVRKVLGATITSMTGLLSKDFIRLVAIAFVISTPIAAYFLNKWLQNFEYRTEAAWWIFGLAGITTLLIALLTVGIQTVRAALSNPVKSLRSE